MATRVAAAAESKKGEREKVAASWLCVSRSAGCVFSVSSSIHVLSLYSPQSLCIHSVCHILVPKPGNSRRSTVFVRESRENALIVWLQTFTVKKVRRNQIVEILVNSFFLRFVFKTRFFSIRCINSYDNSGNGHFFVSCLFLHY